MKLPEETKRELVHEWLDQAGQDFGLAEHLVSQNVNAQRRGLCASAAVTGLALDVLAGID